MTHGCFPVHWLPDGRCILAARCPTLPYYTSFSNMSIAFYQRDGGVRWAASEIDGDALLLMFGEDIL